MRESIVIAKYLRPALAVSLACLLAVGCSGADAAGDDATGEGPADPAVDATAEAPADTAVDATDDGGTADTTHAETIAMLTGLLPADTRGVLAVDLRALLSGDSSTHIAALLNGEGADPALNEPFGAVGTLARSVDVPRVMTSALLAQTTDAADGLFLLARLQGETIDEVAAGPMPTQDGTYGPASRALYLDGNGNHLALLPGGVLVVGKTSVVESVLDVAERTNPGNASTIVPFLDALEGGSHISFVYGLPALFDDAVTPDRTLRGAALMSGALDFAGGDIAGAVAFHTSNASEFVEAYNALNKHAVQGEQPLEQPLTLADPVSGGLGQVVVTVPPIPIDPSPDQVVASRNTVKKLFIGMQAYDYAEDVFDPGNPAWVDLLVKSEQDDEMPPSPGSVFIRWEFRDQAAREAFEANELPAGFSLARTRFFETDDPEGEYFLALNLYNSGGGSIVTGARARVGRLRPSAGGRRSRRRTAPSVHDHRRPGGGGVGGSGPPGDTGRAAFARARRRCGRDQRAALRGERRDPRLRVGLPQARPRPGAGCPLHPGDGDRE